MTHASPDGPTARTHRRFAVTYGPAGRWMYHCHILEHAERDMMGELSITNP